MPSEFELIARFTQHFGPPRPPRGPGDDCAVLPPGRGDWCITTDTVVAGVHFTAAFSPEDVGHKALAVNLSDLAAMGAAPRWFTCAVAAPREVRPAYLRRVAAGMAALAKAHRIQLVGGNFTSASELSITITAAGETPRGGAMLRSGAAPGDRLLVSGTLGEARRGLRDLAAGRARSPAAWRQRRPEPKVKLGLLCRRVAHAGIDLSDGLAQDLGHLCRASRVGARVVIAWLPVPEGLVAFGGRVAMVDAIRGGEDYELLVAVPAAKVRALRRAAAKVGETLTDIGEVTRGDEVVFAWPDGTRLGKTAGWDHFR